MRTRTVTVVALAGLALALGRAGEAQGPAAGASAQAFAVKVTVPGQPDVSTQIVSAPPDASSFGGAYAAAGVAVAKTSAAVSALSGDTGTATAASSAEQVSLFGGEITADAAAGSAKASAARAGDLSGSSVTNLVVLGAKVDPAPNLKVQLGDWGTLTVLAQGSDTAAPQGAKGYTGFVAALDVHLTQAHGGLPAGADVLVGYAEAAAQTAPPPGTTGETTTTLPVPPGNEPFSPHHLTHPGPATHPPPPATHPPPKARPKLDGGPYVFPVYGPVSLVDTFGAERSDVSSGWHHGDDVFGQVGQPLLAVADGTLFGVGWNRLGGNRLWLRDRAGNEFYYAHLAAYSTLAANGAHVRAGDVIGFMGNTGDAESTPDHLHFEIHPVSLLYLDYDGAVDPTRYLKRWTRVEDVEFPGGAAWAPVVHGHRAAPDPGAVLLQSSDLSQADGLDPASLRRAAVPQR